MINESLPKAQRKIAREIIEKGLMREFKEGIEKLDVIISKWKIQQIDNREAYHQLYSSLISTDKHIASRYDGITGSKYVFIIAAQMADGIISPGEISGFSEETKEIIMKLHKFRLDDKQDLSR